MKRRWRDNHNLRPVLVFLGVFVAFLAFDDGRGNIWKATTLFSTLETFATQGIVALGLGMTMVAGEFDLSMIGIYSLAGCVAVMTGETNPFLGMICAIATGALIGAFQGAVVVGFRASSVAVTLGGMLTCNGIAYVLTGNQSLAYDNIDVALGIATPVLGPLTIRALIAFALFVVSMLFMAYTRAGRDMIALGSNRRAAVTSGVPHTVLMVMIFCFSGACAALAGGLVSYSLASASPSGLSDVLLPAAAATILGGVSLGGGSGRPFGLMIGVLTLSFMHAGFNAIGAQPYVDDIAMGSVLLAVGFLDSPDLGRRLVELRLSLADVGGREK